jgi:hypothetical protein
MAQTFTLGDIFFHKKLRNRILECSDIVWMKFIRDRAYEEKRL